ncbi:MAG: hypothetical protein JEZ11_01645 [Desulfobacterales bacterium]|nr:hypothetical protein [Desulfobacterales bacterium]
MGALLLQERFADGREPAKGSLQVLTGGNEFTAMTTLPSLYAPFLGFVTLVCGAYRFAGNVFRRWNTYALEGLAVAWLGTMGLMLLVVDRMRIRAEASETHALRLEGFLPICSHCKKIRDDHDHWHQMEAFIGIVPIRNSATASAPNA